MNKELYGGAFVLRRVAGRIVSPVVASVANDRSIDVRGPDLEPSTRGGWIESASVFSRSEPGVAVGAALSSPAVVTRR